MTTSQHMADTFRESSTFETRGHHQSVLAIAAWHAEAALDLPSG